MKINIDITKEDLDALDLILMCVNEIEEELSYETCDAISRVKKLVDQLNDDYEFMDGAKEREKLLDAEIQRWKWR